MTSLAGDPELEYVITVKFKTKKFTVPIVPDSTTLLQFQTTILEKTGIEIVNQKLLMKGKQMQNVIKADQYLYDTTVDKKKNFISLKRTRKWVTVSRVT